MSKAGKHPRMECETCEASSGEPCVTTVNSPLAPRGTPMTAYHSARMRMTELLKRKESE